MQLSFLSAHEAGPDIVSPSGASGFQPGYYLLSGLLKPELLSELPLGTDLLSVSMEVRGNHGAGSVWGLEDASLRDVLSSPRPEKGLPD